MTQLWSVAVDAPLPEALTYASDIPLKRGDSVIVPLGSRSVAGLVLEKVNSSDFKGPIKSIYSINTNLPSLSNEYISWLEWLSEYYIHPIGLVGQLAFPPLSKQIKQRKSNRNPVVPIYSELENSKKLTEEQNKCYLDILSYHGFNSHLIHGVTGSGKTEVYLQLLESFLQKGLSGLVLVPEISLTPQLVQRFTKRFGDKIAAIHSQLTEREKTNQWWDVVEGKKQILIGARSALFCPIPNLGIIIVDEEHEPSYKQDEKLKYHGRDAAIVLAKTLKIPIVLGSATPSLESWKNAIEGKYILHTMKQRVGNIQLPTVSIVDLKNNLSQEEVKLRSEFQQNNQTPFWMTPQLYEKMNFTLERGEQVALFLNRRGLAQTVLCPSCGHTKECPNCDINLTLHAKSYLVCHYCDYQESFKLKCPDCNEGELKAVGLGTELLEEDLKKLFPSKKVARADRDEISNRQDLENLIYQMENSEIDILVGTQMIAKGLDFPNLKLVGLVLADVGFNLPDFRATERSFQLLVQMSGRAGRHLRENDLPGQVIIQAFNTEHESLRFATTHQFEEFAKGELIIRESLLYPPYGRLIGIRIQGPQQGLVFKECQMIKSRCEKLRTQFPIYTNIEILGPAEAPLSKLNGQFRFHILLKSLNSKILNKFVRQVLGDQKWLSKKIKLITDVDPINLL